MKEIGKNYRKRGINRNTTRNEKNTNRIADMSSISAVDEGHVMTFFCPIVSELDMDQQQNNLIIGLKE